VSLTPAEAQSALKDIEKTENRTAASQHARASAPFLIMWGVIWAVGYTTTAAGPHLSWVWLVLILAGVAGSFLISIHQQRTMGRGREHGARYFASFGVIGLFVMALGSIMQPLTIQQVSAIFPLIVGMFYALIGLWTKGWRMLPLGVALLGLTALGFFVMHDQFVYWMAAVGGGGLVLGGLWLRTA
jgi:fatty acid desaturase